MADSSNPQYSDPGPLFGGAPDFASTGAPGSASTGSGESDQPLMTADVTTLYQSVQASPPARFDVGTGDTSGMSDDMPVHASAITPGPVAAYLQTGSGSGSTIATGHHPNATGRA